MLTLIPCFSLIFPRMYVRASIQWLGQIQRARAQTQHLSPTVSAFVPNMYEGKQKTMMPV